MTQKFLNNEKTKQYSGKSNQVKQPLSTGFGIYVVLHLSFTNKMKNKQCPTTKTIQLEYRYNKNS